MALSNSMGMLDYFAPQEDPYAPEPRDNPPTIPEVPPSEPKKPSIFQSGNRSLSGYMQEAMGAFRPELIKIGDEAGRKRATEDYIRSLAPEMQARGWGGGDVRGEKFQSGGTWVDLLQDIEGAANPQWYEERPGGQGGRGFIASFDAGPSQGFSQLANEFAGMAPLQQNLPDYSQSANIGSDYSISDEDLQSPLLQEMLRRVMQRNNKQPQAT